MIRTVSLLLALAALGAAATGCNVIGYIAAASPPPIVEPQYTGLAGQRIVVMVWADRGIRIDWPTMQTDVCASLQRKLSAQTGKKMALEGATFPYSAQSISRYQEDHPETESDPIETTAVKMGVDRLIYVEIEQFATRSDASEELFRGSAVASVKAVEIIDGAPRIVFEESNIQVFFPPSGPKEGIIRGSDYAMYVGTVDALAQRISQRFVPYEEERP